MKDNHNQKMLDHKNLKSILSAQQKEMTNHLIYFHLAQKEKDSERKNLLKTLSDGEFKHYQNLKKHTRQETSANHLKLWWYYLISWIFGKHFILKLLKKKCPETKRFYHQKKHLISELKIMVQEEEKHEKHLLHLIKEDSLRYAGSVVLGLNDALVELTGALAGFTLALENTTLIGVIGLITGISAGLSMAASEFQSRRAEAGKYKPIRSAFYTWIAHLTTVLLLIMPFFLFGSVYLSLGISILFAIVVIGIFNFYLSVAKELPFWSRFGQMVLISLGVTVITFGISYVLKLWLGMDF